MAKRKNKKAEFVLWMGPILNALRELGDSGSPKEVSDLIAKNLNIPDEKGGFENLCKYILRSIFCFLSPTCQKKKSNQALKMDWAKPCRF